MLNKRLKLLDGNNINESLYIFKLDTAASVSFISRKWVKGDKLTNANKRLKAQHTLSVSKAWIQDTKNGGDVLRL